MSFGARALIRLGALQHNLNEIRRVAPSAKIMAVIKANAYGHGMVAVAKNLSGVDALAVARIPEAIKLRKSGVRTPIVLLSGVLDESEMRAAIEHDLQLVVHCPEQIELLDNCRKGSVIVWLKFDTGMNRLGFAAAKTREIIDQVKHVAVVKELRLMSHLSSADDLDHDMTRQQLDRFASIVEGFDGVVSIGNSAGALGWPAVARSEIGANGQNWIRIGLALFGISPFPGRNASELNLIPVMHFEARLIAVKPLAKGASVGYSGRFESEVDTVFGVISVGYGDGYSRHFQDGTPVLINGRKVRVIGSVSMDLITVDLGAKSDDQVGDIATLWGDGLPVEEVAPWANAIPYELVCGVMNREASEIVN